jgi:GT2 family glycosyltransferase
MHGDSRMAGVRGIPALSGIRPEKGRLPYSGAFPGAPVDRKGAGPQNMPVFICAFRLSRNLSGDSMPGAPVSVIIPAWNLWDMTRDCLESLARFTPSGMFETVVVDNGSSEAGYAQLESFGRGLFGGDFTALRLDRNRGFAVACNSGARAAKGGFVLFLNNDTLLTENWLPPLLDELRSASAPGMAGPLLLFPETDRVQHCGVAFDPNLEVRHLYAHFPSDHPAVSARRRIQALSGAAVLLERDLFFRCGGFHEGYKNGFEDLDLCCELRGLGRRLACVPRSVVYHLTSRTPGRNDHDKENARLINERHPGAFAPDTHLHAAADGFVPALSPSLDFFLRLPDEREAALNAAFGKNFDPARCARRLLAEPLWMRGYELLASYLERKGAWREATEWRLQQARQFPLSEVTGALAKSAARAGLEEVAGAAAAQTLEQNAKAADIDVLLRQAHALLRWAERAGDALVERLYGGWIKRRGLPRGTAPDGK